MKKLITILGLSTLPFISFAQAGHIMQGVGATNMSMGGAATAQPLDISGALQWNPAAISAFNSTILSVNAGAFFSSPVLSSTVPTSQGPFSGVTNDARGASIMPALAMVWGNKNSKHTFGVSVFGISGFGVTFPENNQNPINMPQSSGGFGRIESNYELMQVGLTYSYKITEQLSVGVQPNFDYSELNLAPNPLSSPSQTKGYPVSNEASALGFGGQLGLFYNSGEGIKLGVSYKTTQSFSSFDFKNTYLDGSTAPNAKFKMNYPAILSAGIGYSIDKVDLALDYRFVNYTNTAGFEQKGWTSTAAVAGFGWKDMSVVSAGIQYKGIDKFPLRFGYTYSSNPINPALAFFSTPATAVIKNAFQFGFGHPFSKLLTFNAVYHHGSSDGSTSGPMLSPMAITASNPNGAVPGSNVSYKMSTDLVMIGLDFTLK
ncbi:outer membrane protein transport protein [Mucilaginibacter sp.]|uniref:OmpP1/FadL family transporter n=1 Tax=Mucilaginibacter sp. TaxID=1882438 RepID=UPI00284582A1|nr:outer membrane protein transport protein [Mucilaginibacter sp.]MDR3694619.1 outer membrane protein transport protein [Mucilaginibacter sp.]